MADSAPFLRQRKPGVVTEETTKVAPTNETTKAVASEKPTEVSEKKPEEQVEVEDAYSPWVDILRVLTFLFVASCGLSYLISGGETWFWGMKDPPNYLQTEWWKAQFRGPVYLTPTELSAFNGTDETKPIYLAINGTIYDVSANRRTYGPGGSYHNFAGCDASRAYVTGCFAEDRTVDMRGVEDMYIPLDDPTVDAHWPAEELARMRVAEREDALRRVHDGLKHWVDFFAKSPKYRRVGWVKLPLGWLEQAPVRKLCDVAAQGRSKRKIPVKEGGN